jgi:hypothetical protein
MKTDFGICLIIVFSVTTMQADFLKFNKREYIYNAKYYVFYIVLQIKKTPIRFCRIGVCIIEKMQTDTRLQ